jgi:hypothetical protein
VWTSDTGAQITTANPDQEERKREKNLIGKRARTPRRTIIRRCVAGFVSNEFSTRLQCEKTNLSRRGFLVDLGDLDCFFFSFFGNLFSGGFGDKNNEKNVGGK